MENDNDEWSQINEDEDRQELLEQKIFKNLEVNEEQSKEIAAYPQRSIEWHAARQGRITTSNIGRILKHGYSPGTDADAFLKEMLWPLNKTPMSAFGERACAYGTEMEPIACEIYLRFRLEQRRKQGKPNGGFYISHPGLLVSPTCGWLGCSPDGIVYEDGTIGLLEIKCPWKKTFYGPIPLSYMDQITGTMALRHLPWCDFVVYTPEYTCIQRYPFNKTYWTDVLLPGITKWYFNRYLPRAAIKLMNKLEEGEINVIYRSNDNEKNKQIVPVESKRKTCSFVLST